MRSPRAWWQGLVAEAYTPPFDAPLPSDVATFVAREPVRKIAWRRLRRALWLALNGQRGLERDRIEPRHRRILWIHRGMPQVGDSLMDLACRVLLQGRVDRLDLLTDPHLAVLYAGDDVFAHAYASAEEAAANDYDLVIILSAGAQSLREKLRHFRALPYVNLLGYYTGPEFNRTLYGYHRLDQLLGTRRTPAEIERIARPHMTVPQAVRDAVDALALPPRFVAVALGGVRDWRTYGRWDEVLAALDARGLAVPVVLVGSGNALAARDAILARATGAWMLVDRVDRHALPEVCEILRRSAVVACADGGLMHVAHAAGAPTVALFAERIDPSYRLTGANRSIAFYAPRQLSDIAPACIAEAIAEAFDQGVSGVSVRRV